MKPHRVSDLLTALYQRTNPSYGPGRQKNEWMEVLESVGIRPEHGNRGEERETTVLVTLQELEGLRAEVERLKAESTVAAVSVLVDHARGVLMHRYEGACPDSVEGPDVRDPECPVCRAIDSASGRAVALDALRAQKGGGAT